jgi:hypothetical protein
VPLARVRLTAAESSLRRHRKLRLARPRGSAPASTSEDGLRLAGLRKTVSTSLDPRARPQPRPRKTVSASPDPRARPQPRPRKTVSASPDPRARPQPRPRKMVSASPDPRARPQARPRRSLRLSRPHGSASTSTSEESPPRPTLGSDRPRYRGYIITLPLASSGYGEQDRRPIWLAPVNK